MKIGILILFFVCIAFFCVNADDQQVSLPHYNNTAQIELLQQLSEESRNKYPNRAQEYAQKALYLAEQEGDSLNVAQSLKLLGECFFQLGENDRALMNFVRSSIIFRSISEMNELARIRNRIGSVYRVMGMFDEALTYHLQALREADSLQDSTEIGFSLIYSGIIYRNIGDDKKALDNYQKAFNISRLIQDDNMEAIALNSMGTVYWYQDKLYKSLSYYEEALAIRKRLLEGETAAGLLNNIGNIYRDLGELDKAMSYYDQAMSISKSAGDKNLIAVIYKNVGVSQMYERKFRQAESSYLKSLELAESGRYVRVVMEVLKNLSALYSKTGNYKLALDYYTSYASLQDSVFDQESLGRIAMIQVDNEISEKERINQLLQKNNAISELKNEKQEWVIFFLIIVSVLLVILAVVVYRLYQIKTRSNEKLQVLNNELEVRVKERTERLYEKNLEKKKALEQLKYANESKDHFLANISHELRTPLHAILGIVEMLIDSETDRDKREKLEAVRDSSNHLFSQIKDILDLSLMESGTLALKEEYFDFRSLMNSIYNAIRQSVRNINKPVEVRLVLNDNFPQWVFADPVRIRQVMFHLLGNAIKFTHSGYIEIMALAVNSDEPVNDRTTIRLSVKDTGIGISRTKQKVIFDEFTQLDSGSSRKFGGTGVGLTLSKHLVEMMGGKIWVESEKGSGSKFVVELPVDIGNNNTPKAVTRHASHKQLNILLAEDNKLNANLAMSVLKKMGHSGKMASNGKEAIDYLAREPFDLVIMDIEMPEMDGIEATREIRSGNANVINPQIPIIALTAHALKGYEQKSFNAGMNYYLTKPADFNKLSMVIESITSG